MKRFGTSACAKYELCSAIGVSRAAAVMHNLALKRVAAELVAWVVTCQLK